MRSIFPFHVTDTKGILLAPFAAGAIYTGLSLIAQLIFPTIAITSPIEVAVWIAIAIALATTIYKVSLCSSDEKPFKYWLLAAAAIIAIAVLQSVDLTADMFFGSFEGGARKLEYIGNAGLGILIAAGLMVLSPFPIRYVWLTRALLATISFQVLALLVELVEPAQMSSLSSLPGAMILPTELAELLCIEFYVVAIALADLKMPAAADTAVVAMRGLPATAIGSKMRLIRTHAGVKQSYGHPPWKIAYFPLFQEITLGLAIGWLAWSAGPGVRAATGKAIWQQAAEMIHMWFHDGIDPPSYYAQEFYRPLHRMAAPEYLTRFETKNGLLNTEQDAQIPLCH
jgi:hypothetical protein